MWENATSYDPLSFNLPLKAKVLFCWLRGEGVCDDVEGAGAARAWAGGAALAMVLNRRG